ncbi:hypothetical protein EXIGLDRAFT_745901 [Exidia glandulosa HHB12029]|uniref:Uncharacterized protein n=1 Tax=Exidia glandulosa HHB12029 TaxID=1314781 RepID=A0A165MXY2_EXIGL|nr:hypothetical protein EXIGLDRAFT_745901 [Exidia glandulosa HHB12029]
MTVRAGFNVKELDTPQFTLHVRKALMVALTYNREHRRMRARCQGEGDGARTQRGCTKKEGVKRRERDRASAMCARGKERSSNGSARRAVGKGWRTVDLGGGSENATLFTRGRGIVKQLSYRRDVRQRMYNVMGCTELSTTGYSERSTRRGTPLAKARKRVRTLESPRISKHFVNRSALLQPSITSLIPVPVASFTFESTARKVGVSERPYRGRGGKGATAARKEQERRAEQAKYYSPLPVSIALFAAVVVVTVLVVVVAVTFALLDVRDGIEHGRRVGGAIQVAVDGGGDSERQLVMSGGGRRWGVRRGKVGSAAASASESNGVIDVRRSTASDTKVDRLSCTSQPCWRGGRSIGQVAGIVENDGWMEMKAEVVRSAAGRRRGVRRGQEGGGKGGEGTITKHDERRNTHEKLASVFRGPGGGGEDVTLFPIGRGMVKHKSVLSPMISKDRVLLSVFKYISTTSLIHVSTAARSTAAVVVSAAAEVVIVAFAAPPASKRASANKEDVLPAPAPAPALPSPPLEPFFFPKEFAAATLRPGLEPHRRHGLLDLATFDLQQHRKTREWCAVETAKRTLAAAALLVLVGVLDDVARFSESAAGLMGFLTCVAFCWGNANGLNGKRWSVFWRRASVRCEVKSAVGTATCCVGGAGDETRRSRWARADSYALESIALEAVRNSDKRRAREARTHQSA